MLTDIEIAQQNEKWPIECVAASRYIDPGVLERYGKYKAKIPYDYKGNKQGKLILVTAMNPTPLGEGKTTMSIGLADALNQMNKNPMLCLREPSLGPVFGIKGGAAGGGYAQVVPMEDINLHFTGDIHAIESANNLLAAMIDNHIFQGNELGFEKVTWRRCMDMNDRQLRKIQSGLGGDKSGVPREDGFDITVASEIMAIFCLATDMEDLIERLGNIIVGYSKYHTPIYARNLQAQGAMAALLKDAFNPNLVQTLEHTPAIIHGGPFANIAHGCNSLVATKMALTLGDYVVTEAGFGADLGAEKFLDIKCLYGNLRPDAIVLVATTKALKYNGGVAKEDATKPNKEALLKGLCNLKKHIINLQAYDIPVVVTINRYHTDIDEEIELARASVNAPCVQSTAFAEGGKGSLDLATAVINTIENTEKQYERLPRPYSRYDLIEEKIKDLAVNIYGAKDIVITPDAQLMIKKIYDWGFGSLPICIAKTQYSFSDDPKLLGAPEDFTMTVNEVRLSAGAGFIVVICGKIMTMPGLPKTPAAENISINKENKIVGLF